MSGMNGWNVRMHQPMLPQAGMYPATELELVEYPDEAEDGARGEVRMRIEIGRGHFRDLVFRMNASDFRFFVDAIAARYFAGGP